MMMMMMMMTMMMMMLKYNTYLSPRPLNLHVTSL